MVSALRLFRRFFDRVAIAAFLVSPAAAITIANSNYSAAINPSAPWFLGADQSAAVNLGGVVLINIAGIGGCSGALLADGTSILTAGHCVDAGTTVSASAITIYFPGTSTAYTAASIAVDSGWNGSNSTAGQDLAVIQLNAPAPSSATAYQLDTDPATLGAADVLDGYGHSGTGVTGDSGPSETLQAGENEFLETGSAFDWSPNMLIGQFYDSTDASTNALSCSSGNRFGCRFNPFGAFDEVDISSGDSGGPAFEDVDGTFEIVGVNDLDVCMGSSSTNCTMPPAEYSSTLNSSFGDMFADTSVLGANDENLSFIEEQMTPEPGTLYLIAGTLLAWLPLRLLRSESTRAELAPAKPVRAPKG